jgi:hypothetical protein
MSAVLLHGHHEGLITFGRGYDERREEILRQKPQAEHELRFARMRVLTADEMAALPPLGAESARLRAGSDRRTEPAALIAWHARVCVPECKATPENNWNIFGEDQR